MASRGERLDGTAKEKKKFLALLTAGLISSLIMLDSNIVAVLLPSIARSLGVTFTEIEWVVSAYVLPFAALLLAAGSYADRHGRKLTTLIGLAVFTIASLKVPRRIGAGINLHSAVNQSALTTKIEITSRNHASHSCPLNAIPQLPHCPALRSSSCSLTYNIARIGKSPQLAPFKRNSRQTNRKVILNLWRFLTETDCPRSNTSAYGGFGKSIIETSEEGELEMDALCQRI
jgi:hypothetical protein